MTDTPAPARTPYASRVLDWSDERRAGDGIIVTLANGWAFEPSSDQNAACHVRGFDTVTAAKAGVSKEAKPCSCGRCVPVQALPLSHDRAPYLEHGATVPAWEGVNIGADKLPLPAKGLDNARWGGKFDVPAVGERVRVTYNGLGTATVAGYFTEGGFLGLLLDLDAPSPVSGHSRAHAFGTEFEPLTMAQPVQQQQARAARPAPVAVAVLEVTPGTQATPHRTPDLSGAYGTTPFFKSWGTVFEDKAAGLDGKSYRVQVYQTQHDWSPRLTLETVVYDATGRMLPEAHKPAIRAAALEAYRAAFLTPEAVQASRDAHRAKTAARALGPMGFVELQQVADGTHSEYGASWMRDAAKARIEALKATPVLTPAPEAAAPVQDAPARRYAGTIDLTPTWKGVLRLLLAGYSDGNATGRAIALEELGRMADLADSANTMRAAIADALDENKAATIPGLRAILRAAL
jgi:hypothetical protein